MGAVLTIALLVSLMTVAIVVESGPNEPSGAVAAAIRADLDDIARGLHNPDGSPTMPLPVPVCLRGWNGSFTALGAAFKGSPWRPLDFAHCHERTVLIGDVEVALFYDEAGHDAVAMTLRGLLCQGRSACTVELAERRGESRYKAHRRGSSWMAEQALPGSGN